MNISVNDIRLKVLELEKEVTEVKDSLLKEIFEEYDKVDEIKKILIDLDNCVNGKYEFDSNGELIYGVKIPNNIVDLPFINDYLTQDCAFIPQDMGHHSEIYVAQNCGKCISVNYSHDKDCYFVFDSGYHKAILIKNLSWYDHIYVSAKIEEYQNSIGVFDDIVIIDSYYGSYCKHFVRDVSVNEDNYKTIIKQYEDKYLNSEEDN
jgi:hypothetical protein